MEMVTKLLKMDGWEDDGTFSPQGAEKDDTPRKVMSKGQRRAYIGSKYTTFYTKVYGDGAGTLEDMHTVHNEDRTALAHMANHPEPVSFTPVG